MKYSLLYGNRAIAVPSSLLEIDDPTALRLVLLLSAEPYLCEGTSVFTLAQRLGVDEKAVVYATELLIRNDILREVAEIKTLNGFEIEDAINNDASLRELIDECASICKTVSLNAADISRIIDLKKQLGMENPAIVLLFSFLAEEFNKKGQRLIVSYAFKTANNIKRLTIDEVSEYIESTRQKWNYEGKLRKLFGLGQGKIIPKYQVHFDKWLNEYKMPFELIEKAYDSLSDMNMNKPTYVSKILDDWYQNGIKTPEQAEEYIAKYKNSDEYKNRISKSTKKTDKKNSRNDGLITSFNTDDFFNEALKRSYDNLIKTNNSEK